MTIAIAVKVTDGVVLAADSASTMSSNGGASVATVYNNANKIICLKKGLPLGVMTWGRGSIGPMSIASLMKELRTRFTEPGKSHQAWKLSEKTYKVESVAKRVHEFVCDEKMKAFKKESGQSTGLGLGLLVAGFSPGEDLAELWLIGTDDAGDCSGPVLISPTTQWVSLFAHGQPEAVYRIVSGYDPRLADLLSSGGVDSANIQPLMDHLTDNLQSSIVSPAMPIQDTIDLAQFLAEVSVGYSRFTPGWATVGGPIEVAAITKFEGFKWIRRKYFYDRSLNPEEGR